MDDRIRELYEILRISYEETEKNPSTYDMKTYYEKCGITIDVPTTVNNFSIMTISNDN